MRCINKRSVFFLPFCDAEWLKVVVFYGLEEGDHFLSDIFDDSICYDSVFSSDIPFFRDDLLFF